MNFVFRRRFDRHEVGLLPPLVASGTKPEHFRNMTLENFWRGWYVARNL